MTTLGTENKEGVRVSYSIDFDGTSKRFEHGDIISVSDLNNSGDSLDSKRKISDLTFSVYDADDTLWGQIGHGTTAFGKPVSMRVFIGGTYGNLEKPNGTELVWQGTQGGNNYLVHTGSVVNVRKSNKLITFRSQNKLNKIKDLRWQPPVRTGGLAGEELTSFYGSYAFYNMGASTSQEMWDGTMIPYCLYDITEDGHGGVFWATISENIVESNFQGTGIYDTSGAGIDDFIANGFEFLDTKFFNQFPPVKLKGTFFGTYIGTIETEAKAKTFGYETVSEANADNTANPGETGTYTPNRIRIEFGTTLDPEVKSIYEMQNMNLKGDPIAVARHCLFGKMVSDFLDESSDMGNSFANSQKSVAFQTYDSTFTLDDAKVSSAFDNILETTNSIFFVNSNNQFEMRVYGPEDLSQTLNFISTSDVIRSSFENDVNDWYNRVVIKYGYDFQEGKYLKEKVGTLDSWSQTNDRTLSLESLWIKNENQVDNLMLKTLRRVGSTIPEYTIETSLKYSGNELGSLMQFEDPNTVTGTKIIQLVEYTKGFYGDKKVKFRAFDGDALYRQRGYARWEDSSLGAAVSGTSKSGWDDAVALGGNTGTVNIINENLYGSHFVWW